MSDFEDRLRMFLQGIAVDLETELVRVAPVKTGYLKNSIEVRLVGMDIEIYMPEYAMYVEFGTAPHIITPNSAQALHWKSDGKQGTKGKDVFAKIVHHPGSQPFPFIRNTFIHKLPAIVALNAERFIPEVADMIEVSI